MPKALTIALLDTTKKIMYIESIELKDFRNYTYLNLELDEKINLLYGDNAQGKTNILESICIAATTRSHRGAKDDEMIRLKSFGDIYTDKTEDFLKDEDAHIKVIVKKEFSSDRIDIHLKKGKAKGIALNGIPVRRSADIFGILQIVFFCPEDLDIIRRGPGVRRHFLDMDISRVNTLYLERLLVYNKVLESRNKLLKKIGFEKKEADLLTLDILDEQLVQLGKEVIEVRRKYIKDLNVLTSDIYGSISGKNEKSELVYEPQTSDDTFTQSLKSNREKDLRSGQTNTGPHRDDFTFFVNGSDVKKFGSQGQKRTAALSLKLAQIDIAKEMTGELPVLLLDDVLSELDFNRQRFLLEKIGNMQTLITCTGRDSLIKQEFEVDRVFKVTEGKVEEESYNIDTC